MLEYDHSRRTGWAVILMPPDRKIDCYFADDHVHVRFDFETPTRDPPSGSHRLDSLALYRPGSSMPYFQEKLGKGARVDIRRTSPPIGRLGAHLGAVKLDVRLRDGKSVVSGETALVDCDD